VTGWSLPFSCILGPPAIVIFYFQQLFITIERVGKRSPDFRINQSLYKEYKKSISKWNSNCKLKLQRIMAAGDALERYFMMHIAFAYSSRIPPELSVSRVLSTFQSTDYGKLRPYLRKCITGLFDGACPTEFLVLKPSSLSAR